MSNALSVKRDTRKGRRGYRIRGTIEVWKDGECYRAEIDEGHPNATYQEAKAIARQKEDRARRETIGNLRPEEIDHGPTLSDALDKYEADKPGVRFTDKPRARLGHVALSQLTDEMILDEGHKVYAGRSPETLRRQWWTPIKAAVTHYFAPPKPERADRPRTHIFRPKHAEIVIDYFRASRWAEDHFGAALVTTLFGCGGRVGETLAVDGLNDTFPEYSKFMFRDTKNGHERAVYMPPRVRAAISVLPTLGQSGPLFRRFDGKPFKVRDNRGGQIRNRFARAVERAGLDPLVYTPHVARHSWATWFHSQVKSEVDLQRNGGWNSEVYKRYVHISSDELGREALEHGWDFRGALGEEWRSQPAVREARQ